MGSLSTLHLRYSPVAHRSISQSPSPKLHLPECFTISTWIDSNKSISWNPQSNHSKISKMSEARVAHRDGLQVHDQVDLGHHQMNEVEDHIEYIRMLLKTTGNGRISMSPYDTAWIALIKDVEGRHIPQFPSSLEWIAKHQLPDGSWGDEHFFCVYDRLVNTLACVVALTSWNDHADKSKKGISYIKENVHKLEKGKAEHMTGGFELVFPALLQRAKDMGIHEIPYDAPQIKEIYDAREKKLTRIPMEVVHKVPTSLLYSLEGLENLVWEKLLRMQSADGSFLTSPASTAFAFIHTKDQQCFNFIRSIVEIFNGGAPHTYPVDIFARLWAVDRLQRLGISRFFESEIVDCLSHVHKFWTNEGLFSGRETEFCDIDDTSMGFRLLRIHGYDVDPNVLWNFKQGDKFSCYGGQMIETASPIYNLYRASQLQFPGEGILKEANEFAYEFLSEQLANNELLDKWVISQHLADEIRIGLQMPWYATLPRVEAIYYLQHYAGADEVWIGKTLYRMPEISNDAYLELARKDFKRCQAQHQFEWIYMQEWYESCFIQEFGISIQELLHAYFLATASIFEQERKKERIAWAKSQIISKIITSFFNNEATSLEQKDALLTEVRNINGLPKMRSTKREDGVVNMAVATLDQFLRGFDVDTCRELRNAWCVWLRKLKQGEANGGAEAELLTTTLNICAARIAFYNEDILSHHEYKTLSSLTNKICQELSDQIRNKQVEEMEDENRPKSSIKIKELEQDMQSLVKLVLKKSMGMNRNIKQTFLSVVKTYYYRAYYGDDTIDTHIFKVLFKAVI